MILYQLSRKTIVAARSQETQAKPQQATQLPAAGFLIGELPQLPAARSQETLLPGEAEYGIMEQPSSRKVTTSILTSQIRMLAGMAGAEGSINQVVL